MSENIVSLSEHKKKSDDDFAAACHRRLIANLEELLEDAKEGTLKGATFIAVSDQGVYAVGRFGWIPDEHVGSTLAALMMLERDMMDVYEDSFDDGALDGVEYDNQ